MLGFGKKKKKTLAGDFEVPSFPSAVLGLLSKLRDPEISSNELADDLELDPGLHVRVLKTVNSAAFGLSHKVSNIHHAVNLLGRGRLESLVLAVAVKDTLTGSSQAPWLNMGQFWATAARRAAIARGLAGELHPHIQSDVFTIGLLQDMAVPIIANREGNRYRDLYLAWLDSDDFDLIEQEQAHCGIDHATLGAQIASDWGFPDSLIEAISQHHQQDSVLPLSVKIAALVKGTGDREDAKNIVEQARQRYNLDSALTVQLIEDLLLESRALAAALG